MSHGRCPDAWRVVIGCTKVHGMAYCAATRGGKKTKKTARMKRESLSLFQTLFPADPRGKYRAFAKIFSFGCFVMCVLSTIHITRVCVWR